MQNLSMLYYSITNHIFGIHFYSINIGQDMINEFISKIQFNCLIQEFLNL